MVSAHAPPKEALMCLQFLDMARPVLVENQKGDFVILVDEDVVEDVGDITLEGG